MRCITYTAVLLLGCTLACVASEEHRCIFDELARENNFQKSFVVQEVSRQRNSSGGRAMITNNENWESIRIGYFMRDMDNEEKYCSAVGEERSDLRGGTLTCTQSDVLTPERKSQLVWQVITRAVLMHTDRLKVKRLTTDLVVRRFRGICSNFKVPNAHLKVGIPDVDTVLYIAAAPTASETLAWAQACNWLREDWRPSAGVINLSPSILESPMHRARTVAHEITHVLGFTGSMLEEYVDVKKVFNVRGKPEVMVVASPKTIEMTRAYFDCPTAEGMELEDEEGAPISSHWERRNAKDELMSGIAGAARYTTLTMAALEDTELYKAVWEKAEPMFWGKGLGCWFLEQKCVENGATQYADMFCDIRNIFPMCTSDRYALGFCDVTLHDNDIPIHFVYFHDPRVGASAGSLMDYCPYIKKRTSSTCNRGNPTVIPGSRISDKSRCVRGVGLAYNGRSIGDICVEISCVLDPFMVRFAGDERWYECPEKTLLHPPSPFSGGSIVCPLRDEVCIGLDNII